jgi:exosortase
VENIATSAQQSADSKSSRAWSGRHLLIGACLFLLWLVLCRHLSSEWSLNEQYNYGWFVPFFAAYLVWLRFEELRTADCGLRKEKPINKKLRALVMGAGALALLVLFPVRLFEIANPDWRPLGWVHALAVITITFVLIYFAGGWRWVTHFSFSLLFFLVAVPWISPIEGPIVLGLMRTIASLAAEAVSLLGMPAQVQGNLIRIASGVVGVNEACSGVRSLQTSLMIGLLFGELKRLSAWSRVVLVAGAITIALIANFSRAVFLVWMASTRELAAVDHWHDFAGYAIVALVFLGSLLLATILNRDKVEISRNGCKATAELSKGKGENGKAGKTENGETRSQPFLLSTSYFPLSIPTSYLLISLTWLFAIEISVESWYRAHERNLIARVAWSVQPPATATGLHEIKIEETVRQTLRFDAGREVVWKTTDASAPEISTTNYLFFFRWNPGSSSVVRARAHRPDICLPSAGWKQIADRGMKTYLVRDGIALPARHVSFKQESGNAVVHTFFCLQEDKVRAEELVSSLPMAEGVQPDWSLKARTRMVRNGVRNLGQQVLEVVFLNTRPIDDQTAEDKFQQMLRELIVVQDGK